MENKSGFIKIIEVVTMILIITGLLLVVLNNSQSSKNRDSKETYELEQSVLKKIQLSESLRAGVLATEINSEFNLAGIYEDKLNNFICKAKVCSLTGECLLGEEIEKNIYSQEAIIAADLNTYSPRKLKIFCWKKG